MKAILTSLFNHEQLSTCAARELLVDITKGKYNDTEIASLLTVFQMRGIKVDELIGFREALLSTRLPISFEGHKVIDIVGTGGDGKDTFNISTCSCFVVAGAGYKVAKHGNYAASSVSGASTVLEFYGAKFSAEQDKLTQSLEQSGMAYMHAPLFNPAMKCVAGVRRSLGVRTIFNLLGPLVNPCLPDYQLLGVADLAQMRIYTSTFEKLGVNFAVVSSLDGYDEISLTSKFKVMTNNYETIHSPSDLGFETLSQEALYGGKTTEEAAKIFLSVLSGKSTEAQRNCVLANAAFAIQVIEDKKSITECLTLAKESLESGRALKAFEKFIELNR